MDCSRARSIWMYRLYSFGLHPSKIAAAAQLSETPISRSVPNRFGRTSAPEGRTCLVLAHSISALTYRATSAWVPNQTPVRLFMWAISSSRMKMRER
jgi:hypothetical protein